MSALIFSFAIHMVIDQHLLILMVTWRLSLLEASLCAWLLFSHLELLIDINVIYVKSQIERSK